MLDAVREHLVLPSTRVGATLEARLVTSIATTAAGIGCSRDDLLVAALGALALRVHGGGAGVAAAVVGGEDVTRVSVPIEETDNLAEIAVALQLAGIRQDEPGVLVVFGDESSTVRVALDLVGTSEVQLLVDGDHDGGDVLAWYLALLGAAIAEPDRAIGTLPLLAGAAAQDLTARWNDTDTALRLDATAPRLVEDQVRRTPDAIAVRVGERRISYRELNERANRLAHHLRRLGVGPDRLVALSLGRSEEMVIAVLAVMKAGGAYVPVDPTYPIDRIRFMLEDAAATVVITESRWRDLVADTPATVVLVDDPSAAVLSAPTTDLDDGAAPTDLAYVIYTSGSTGRPKGVMVEHSGLSNYLLWACDHYAMREGTGALLHSPLSFDFTITLLLAPLLVGTTVHLVRDDTDPSVLVDALREHRDLSVVKLTPAHLELVARLVDPADLAGVTRCLVVGGEALLTHHVRFWQDADPAVIVINEYGPTETVVGCCVYTVPADLDAGPVPIGVPIANTRLYVLDAGGNPVPPGVVGELFIGGAGVARGYLGQPELTAERFLPDPFSTHPGATFYRTGDLARYRPNGVLDFLGRTDHQVKINGHRIEIGEVESVLAQHAHVGEAAVVALDGRLVAYVTPAGDVAPSPSELRRFAARALPSFMVPASAIVLDALPLTPNGKLDRRLLPEPDGARPDLDVAYVAPRNQVEAELVAIWEEALEIRPIGVTDEFWDLGVDSLAAARLFTAVERAFDRKLPLAPVFQAPSIEKLAVLITEGGAHAARSSLVAIQPGGERPPLFCTHGGAGTVLHLRELAHRLGDDQPFYGLQCRGLYGGERPLTSVRAMATHYLREVRSVQPHGPYRLLGYCMGGLTAYEMAQQLRADGEEVELVGMISTVAPSYVVDVRERRRRERLARAGKPATLTERMAHERQLSAETSVLTLLTRARRSLAWHARRRRERMVLGAVRIVRAPVPESLRHRFFRIANNKAEKRYRPKRYPGSVVLWFAEGMDDRPDLGWPGLPDLLEVRPISGEHRMAKDLTMEPSVGLLAAMINDELDRLGHR